MAKIAQRDFIFIHDRPFTQHTALVVAYDLKQARKLLRRSFPKPNAWTIAVIKNGRRWIIKKHLGNDVFWEGFRPFNFMIGVKSGN